MSTDPYSASVRALFAEPAHAGDLDGGRSVLVDEQDVRVRLTAVAAEGRITAMRFLARGCPHVIAACESICAACEGGPVGRLLEFPVKDLMENLPVPVEKTGRILVIEDAVRSLGLQFRNQS